jgi:two-component system OmpR family sensor kinase
MRSGTSPVRSPPPMKSFRTSLALRMALGGFALFVAVGVASVLALRSILASQLDRTLLHLAEVEAQAGAAVAGPEFVFHEGVLLAAGEGTAAELIRYAQLWTDEGRPVVRSKNLPTDLELPADAYAEARAGRVGWATHLWDGRRIRSVIYPLGLVGAAHHVHLLQVAAPTDPLRQTLLRFSAFLAGLMLLATFGAYALGRRIAGVALRPTGEITAQAEAITAGTLSERITAHADVEEFTRLVNVLNGMLDRLRRALDLQRQFTADASHELRGPLTVLKGDIDVTLKRERTVVEYRATLERCREEVDRLARLAGDLLVLARSDAALPLEHVSEVDLRDVVERVRGRFRALAEGRGVRVEVHGPSALVTGDPGLLERVVGNLLDNAVKHCRSGGVVEAQITLGRAAVLTVRDEGPGIPEEHVGQLFHRFFRADPARQRSAGSGLGLAIARAGAEVHGGKLEFAGNSPGAVFRLTLPVRSAAA